MDLAKESTIYRFADCELDPREHRLIVRGRPVILTPKVFDTLVLLVVQAGHVVSKDELMQAIWPRGFVHESNLTKHIWLIRRALGDGEEESRFIQTVPKLGYRFVAPVQLTASISATPVATSSKAIEPGAQRRSRVTYAGLAAAAVLAAGVVAVAVVGQYPFGRAPAVHKTGSWAADAGAVAIVDFNNLSGNAKDGWVGPALEQMLATEVAADGKLHAVPEELVRPARADLPAPDAGGYGPTSLATLQQRIGAHYVLSGAYLVSGSTDAPQLRVDLTLQDAKRGKSLATLSHVAAVNDLPHLIASMGSELRSHFGGLSADASAVSQLAAAQPPTAEVARHFGFALQALDQYDAARARDEMLQVISQSPGYAPAHLQLARAWSMLGFRVKALAAAKQAAQYADGLPREVQLQIRAQQAALAGEVKQKVTWSGELSDLRPNNPDYRLGWVEALIDAAEYGPAQAALQEARKRPELDQDPRVELAAAKLESARGNDAAVIPHARGALAQARRRGETGLIAEAQMRLGVALDKAPGAESLLRAAAADYRRIGNPHGEAMAWQNLANLMVERNQQAAAREAYQRAMSIYQGVGDLGGEAAIYDNLSRMLWAAGDRDGTEAALRQALAIGRETNDPVRQAWSLTGLATVLADESAGDEILSMYRQAIELDRQAGRRTHLAFALTYYADLLRIRGQLGDAAEACSQARQVRLGIADASGKLTTDFECAQISLDRGNVDAAAASLKRIEEQAIAARDEFNAANAELVIGQISMGRDHWDKAREELSKSLQSWDAQKEAPGIATAQALLALCDDALGDGAGRDSAAAQAREQRGGITARQEVLTLDISLAQLQADAGQVDGAMATLRNLAVDATQRHWAGYAFEARLAALRVRARGSDVPAIRSLRAALVANAQKAGFGWVRERAERVAGRPARSRPLEPHGQVHRAHMLGDRSG